MQICLMIEGQEGVTWQEWVGLAQSCEEVGLHGLFRSDHYSSIHGAPGPALDAWATLAGLAPHTTRIRLGTLVSPSTFRHPSELARVVATVDHASGGRVDVGLGAGWFEDEHRQNGFPFPSVGQRYDRLSEYLEVLVRSWHGEPFDFPGEHFQLVAQRALPVPVQSPHPPIVLGGAAGARSLALAARYASEYNTFTTGPEAAEKVRQRLDAACASAGRDSGELSLSAMSVLALGRDEADAKARLDRQAEHFSAARGVGLAATIDEAADLFARYEAVGMRRMYIQHPVRDDRTQVELLGELATRLKG